MAAPPWSSSPTRNWFIQLAFYIILKLFFTPLPSTVWKNIKFFNLLTNFFHKQLVFFHFPKPLSKAWVFLFPLHGRSWNINYYHQQLKYLSSMAFSSHLFFSSIVTLTWSRPCKESIADMILWVAYLWFDFDKRNGSWLCHCLDWELTETIFDVSFTCIMHADQAFQ